MVLDIEQPPNMYSVGVLPRHRCSLLDQLRSSSPPSTCTPSTRGTYTTPTQLRVRRARLLRIEAPGEKGRWVTEVYVEYVGEWVSVHAALFPAMTTTNNFPYPHRHLLPNELAMLLAHIAQ